MRSGQDKSCRKVEAFAPFLLICLGAKLVYFIARYIIKCLKNVHCSERYINCFMKYFKTSLTFFFLILMPCAWLHAQPIAPSILNKAWNAYWITVPNQPTKDYGVHNFRKTFSLANKPSSFTVHISGDNRYKLFVNGKLASHGPARGDLYHWSFETVDIAAFLKTGNNIITSIVWNDGAQKPEAQISYRTAFILQGNTANEEIINTNNSWKCKRDSSYKPLTPELVYSYYVAGPGEMIDMNQSETDWMNVDFKDEQWQASQQIFHGLPKGIFAHQFGWMLVPRTIPQMELTEQRLQKVRRAEGITLPASFPAQKTTVTIPANTKATILLDQTFLTNAYPTINFNGGKNATISLAYNEALYINEGDQKDWRAQHQKGNRNEVEGKRFVGKEDRIISNGSANQNFTSLSWRTFRYLQLKIETKDEPLQLEDLYSTFTGYPFNMNAKFDADTKNAKEIMDVSWRTARLCANETYMDCPYYEQLQYVGDTRIQALISLFNTGDDRLMRNAISQIDNSRMAEGATLSRYPTANSQEIPPFSLWWIGMLHDYWKYRPDVSFVKSMLPGERQVLWFFSKYQQNDGSLKNVPYWNFTDWATSKGWNNGIAPVGKNGNSAALDFQLLLAYQVAAELENKVGMRDYATKYFSAAAQLKQTLKQKYWDASKQLYADTPDKDFFSQHVNSLAILTDAVTGKEANDLGKRILNDTSLTQATIYFKYYVHQALTKAGYGNDYLNWLEDWHNNLTQGMTTWAEISDINNARSDCHAWGSHPNIEFFRTVLGIDSDAPGFSKIKIEPHLGSLKKASGEIPHPNGKINTSYQFENNKWNITIQLPANTPGRLIWNRKRYELKPGKNSLNL